MASWKEIRRKVRYRLIYVAVKAMIFFSRLIPRKAWISFCGLLGGMSYYVASQSRSIALNNLKRAYPEKSPESIKNLARKVFIMMGRNAGDVLRAFPITDFSEFEKLRSIEGVQHVEQAYQKGKGVLFITAHLGAFELIANEMAFRGYKPLIIGTPMKDERLTQLLWRQRSKLGATAIERGKETVKILKNLKGGGTVAILIDQDTKVKSVFVDFFGHPCATPIGAAMLALRTEATVLPVFIHLREDGKQHIKCYPAIELIRTGNDEEDILRNTQVFTSVIEHEIRKHPEQWLWMHERWKTRPGEETG